MNAERHAEVRRLFLAAHELNAGAIEAFLEQACGADMELRAEVQSLLAHAGSSKQPGVAEDDPAAPPSELPRERILPGTIVAGRYRILAPLGRGGMGEVYRADDLKLDHAVALKFLARALAGNPAGRGSLVTEVKLALKVSHPNVARVYDIGEAAGELFISMEFIDGEDLASLLRRVDRLSGDKILQVARELCLGLGAAHDRGVLHRDLKPANVMLDGNGHVRITDFGIAALESTVDQETRVPGTPGFMAPELFAGKPASIRSDLYALGMVLYEVATGREPFHGVPPYDRRVEDRPVAPSLICPEIDPALERITLECLQADPRRRPDSAYAVAAALPECDPLAALMAAGVTPSPSLVAAGGTHRAMRRGPALLCLATALAGLPAVVLLAGRTFFLPQAGLSKPPAVLAEKAREVIGYLGYPAQLEGSLQGFTIDRDYLRYRMAAADRHRNWDDLATGRPPAVFFWYYRGRTQLLLPPILGEPSLMSDLPNEPGVTAVHLDALGRLLEFSAWPERSALPDDGAGEPDWAGLFQRAGLDMARFRIRAAAQPPPMYADRVRAWESVAPENAETRLRVEGASLGRRVVYFKLLRPWDRTAEVSAALTSAPDETPWAFVARFFLYLLVSVFGSMAAWHNVGLGRSDLQGARRLAWFVLGLGLLEWLLGEQHAAVLIDEAKSFYLGTARAALAAGVLWICYLGMEPSVRRFWPHTMISWSRLLAGRFRDPLVGRDLLLGCILGVGLVLIMQFDSLVPQWFHWPLPLPKLPQRGYELGELLGVRYKLGVVASTLSAAVATGLALLLVVTLLRIILRNRRLSSLAACLFLALYFSFVAIGDAFLPWLTHGLGAMLFFLVLTRVGLVAITAGLFVKWILVTAPLTANQLAWYAPSSNFVLAVLIALVGHSFFTALGGQSLLGRRSLDGD